MKRVKLWIISSLIVAMAVFGCERDTDDAEPAPQEKPAPEAAVDDEEEAAEKAVDPQDDPRRQVADEADQTLRQTLMGRVMGVAREEGFAAAVDVCHDEAIPLTEEVGEEFGVEIGRVADRLRNPDNVGHDWVWEMIEEADGEAHYVANDQFRAVKPIPLAEGCLNCHGQQDELAEGVSGLLAERYPDDEATGYDVGDLRGWVWVEVP